MRVSGLAVLAGTLMVLALIAAAPAAAGQAPATCRVGVALTSVHNLDISNGTFDADFWIWSLCPDDSHTPLSTMQFINANATSLSMAGRTDVDGIVWRYVRVEGTFRHHWDVVDFPFDRQDLRIVMEETDAYAKDFLYEPDRDGRIHEPDMDVAGWRVASASLDTGTRTYHTTYGDPAADGATTDYAQLALTLRLERTEMTGFIKLTFLVYVAFVISLIAFAIHPDTTSRLYDRLAITSATVFAIVLSLRAASSELNSGNAVTLVDWLHLTALAAMLVSAISGLVCWALAGRGRPSEVTGRVDRAVMVFIATGFVIVNVVLIGRAAMA